MQIEWFNSVIRKVKAVLVFVCGTRSIQKRTGEGPKFSAAQIGIREGGTKVCPRAAFTRLVLEIEGQPFYGWFVDGSNEKTQARF